MPTAIFISHATADDPLVTRLHDDLERASGCPVWVDHHDIDTGDNWQLAIDNALRGSTHVIVCLSPASVASQEVTAEWRTALANSKRLLPVVLAVVLADYPRDQLSYRLTTIQGLKLTPDSDWDAGIARLANLVRRAGGADAPDDPEGLAFTGWRVTSREPIDRKLTSLPLQGRAGDLAQVLTALQGQPVMICGVGGRGKSRLALEALVSLETGGLHGAIWHVADTYSTEEDLHQLLREHYNLPPTTDRREAFQRLRAEPCLIVLDNLEDVTGARAAYHKWIEEALRAGARVLLTSRVEWDELPRTKVIQPTELTGEQAAGMVRALAQDLDERRRQPVERQAGALAEAARRYPRLIELCITHKSERG
jgi:hypothetical protein